MPSVTVVTVVQKRPAPTPPARPPLWFHREDPDVFGRLRTCAQDGHSCPAVFVLKEPSQKVQLTREWQFALAAWNPGMKPEDVAVELDYRLAFTNGTGLTKPGVPRRDYLRNKDL